MKEEDKLGLCYESISLISGSGKDVQSQGITRCLSKINARVKEMWRFCGNCRKQS